MKEQIRAQCEDILAVQKFDGSESLVCVDGPQMLIGGKGSTDFVRVSVLNATCSFSVFQYVNYAGDACTPYEHTFPVILDATCRRLAWDELQPLMIVPLYRRLDAACGAEYAKHTYEYDSGRFVAARLYLRDAGYDISSFNHQFYAASPGERHSLAKIWTCQELIDEALLLRKEQSTPKQLSFSL